MSVLARNGIPGPKPNLLFGNLFKLRNISSIQRQNAWIKKYGKIVGCYSGAKPIVLVADPVLAKNIQIKDFNYFADRPHMPTRFLFPHPRNEGSLMRCRGKRWKQIRSILTPTFSASKLKTMSSIIDDSIDTFIDNIHKYSNSGEECNIYDLYQSLTADVIGRTAFGIQSGVQKDPKNKFFKAAKDITEMKANKLVYLLINCFPQLDHIIYPIRRLDETLRDKFSTTPLGVLLDMTSYIIKLRKNNSNLRRNDILQVMLDLKISKDEITDEKLTASYGGMDLKKDLNNNCFENDIKSSSKRNIRLTEDEIKANCALMYAAGYETTSTSLAFVSHILVNYPEVQESLRREVQLLNEIEGKLDFNTVNKLELMESVINETLRLYPPVFAFTSRQCLNDYKYEDMTIPKGTTVVLATHYLHHDPDYWDNPEEFQPMRFSRDRGSGAPISSFQPFGIGPRNCVGMRFAFFEIKLCLAKLLLKYRLERSLNTQIGELSTKCKLISQTPKTGVFVKVIQL